MGACGQAPWRSPPCWGLEIRCSLRGFTGRRATACTHEKQGLAKDARTKNAGRPARRTARPLFDPVACLHRYERIPPAQLDDTIEVLRLRDAATYALGPETPQFVAIEIADELVNERWRRGRTRVDAVMPQLLEDTRSLLADAWPGA